jgi:primary-amine oxidase
MAIAMTMASASWARSKALSLLSGLLLQLAIMVSNTVMHYAHRTYTDSCPRNLDYMFDYGFHMDGSLEVSVRASGYLQSSFYYPTQSKWGPRIQQATQGSLHDHIITFKGDFDVLGTGNSLQVSELKVVNQSQPWFPELGVFEQMEMDVSIMTKENKFNWAPNNQAMYVVLNPNATNAWGELRGYRIVPGRSDIHLSTLNSPWSLKNSEFAKTHLAVSRQHDNEVFANSVQNANLPFAPQQDFSKFFDGENIEDEDLVVWFNLGMHHFTRSEDVPVCTCTLPGCLY